MNLSLPKKFFRRLQQRKTYAEQYLRNNELTSDSRCRKWVPMTYIDIKMYICALICRDILWKPASKPRYVGGYLEKYIQFIENESLPEN